MLREAAISPKRESKRGHVSQPLSVGKMAAPVSNVNSTTLVDLCRIVITTNLERYPPEAFGVCDCDEWQAIVRLRHARTQPKRRWCGGGTTHGARSSCTQAASKGKNAGIDGTGRMVPAVSDKVIFAIEACNPHLSDSPVVDALVWKDCVEYKFRRGDCGALLISRPIALYQPWPLFVQELQNHASHLVPSSESMDEAIDALRRTPMNVALLKDSGVGKRVKKAIKHVGPNHKGQLESLLKSWMDMAANDGVFVGANLSNTSEKAPKQDETTTRADLALAETCHSWRHLFLALQQRNEEIRNSQGKRMREIRKNVRPIMQIFRLIIFFLTCTLILSLAAGEDSPKVGQSTTDRVCSTE
jgi:TFIIS helical bundle-like domain